MLAIVTQSFGVRGRCGDLLIEPKLSREQFKDTAVIGIDRSFAGKNLRINFYNPKKLSATGYKIARATLNSRDLALKEARSLLIGRKTILNLPSKKLNIISIILG